MGSLRESEFASLCQDVMTGVIEITESDFFEKVSETLFKDTDPITKSFLKEKSSKLYAFLNAMKTNPMRVHLSHAMSKTFVDALGVDSKEISKLLLKHNAKYFTNPELKDNYYVHHILDREGLNECEERIRVVFIFDENQGVELEFIGPFKTGRGKTMYVDMTYYNVHRPKGEKTTIQVGNDDFRHHNEFTVHVPNEEILSVKTSVGESLREYYYLWTLSEDRIRDDFIRNEIIGNVGRNEINEIDEDDELNEDDIEFINQHLFGEMWG